MFLCYLDRIKYFMFFWRFIWYLCYNSVVYFCRIVKRSTRAATRKLVYSSFGLGVERDLAVISVFRSHLMMSADKLRENVMLSSIAMVWTERSVVLRNCRSFFYVTFRCKHVISTPCLVSTESLCYYWDSTTCRGCGS